MILFKIFFPILFYTTITAILTEVFPASYSVLFCTGISAFISTPFLYYLYRKEQKGQRFIPRRPSLLLNTLPLLLLLSASSCILFNNLLLLPPFSILFSGTSEPYSKLLYHPPFWEQLLFTVLFIPIAEELIFRGQIFTALRKIMPLWPAAFLSSLIFGIYHGNIIQGIYAFCLGLIMAWLAECYQRIFPSCLFHITSNFLSVLITRIKWVQERIPLRIILMIELPFALICFIVSIQMIRHRLSFSSLL